MMRNRIFREQWKIYRKQMQRLRASDGTKGQK
jgi:hypothetical protein